MSRTRPVLLAVGLSCLDLVWHVATFPPEGSRTDAAAHHRHGGGPAATAAVAAVRYGVEARLWAIHGDDDAGRSLLRELTDEGVDVSRVRVPAGSRSFVSAVLVGSDGERWIFPYRGEGLDDDPDAWPIEQVASVDAVLTDLRHPRLARAVLRAAREANVPSVVDLGNLRDLDATEDATVVIAAREAAEELLVRSGAAVGGAGGTAGGDVADASEMAEAALAALRWRDDQTVAVTLGDEGVVYDAGDGLRHLPALPVEVRDTTGAGDVFHGVWAAALASGADADTCARHASVAAALSCGAPGRGAIPSGDEVARLLERRTAREMNELRWS
ncbi:MAG: PfkB family carbohydrate kinase [Trueperaceae bacterium]|nr:PfkB family carbohydrate kinase [Trueperaceae bacterium]